MEMEFVSVDPHSKANAQRFSDGKNSKLTFLLYIVYCSYFFSEAIQFAYLLGVYLSCCFGYGLIMRLS